VELPGRGAQPGEELPLPPRPRSPARPCCSGRGSRVLGEQGSEWGTVACTTLGCLGSRAARWWRSCWCAVQPVDAEHAVCTGSKQCSKRCCAANGSETRDAAHDQGAPQPAPGAITGRPGAITGRSPASTGRSPPHSANAHLICPIRQGRVTVESYGQGSTYARFGPESSRQDPHVCQAGRRPICPASRLPLLCILCPASRLPPLRYISVGGWRHPFPLGRIPAPIELIRFLEASLRLLSSFVSWRHPASRLRLHECQTLQHRSTPLHCSTCALLLSDCMNARPTDAGRAAGRLLPRPERLARPERLQLPRLRPPPPQRGLALRLSELRARHGRGGPGWTRPAAPVGRARAGPSHPRTAGPSHPRPSCCRAPPGKGRGERGVGGVGGGRRGGCGGRGRGLAEPATARDRAGNPSHPWAHQHHSTATPPIPWHTNTARQQPLPSLGTPTPLDSNPSHPLAHQHRSTATPPIPWHTNTARHLTIV
jgi:hypothetical protein